MWLWVHEPRYLCAFSTRLSASVGAESASAAHRVAAMRCFSLGRIILVCRPSGWEALLHCDHPLSILSRAWAAPEQYGSACTSVPREMTFPGAVWECRTRNGHTAVIACGAFADRSVLDCSARCTTCSSDYYNCKQAQVLSRLAEGGAAAGAGSRTPVLTHTEWLGQLKSYLSPTGEVLRPITSIWLRTWKAIRNSSPPAKVTRGFCMLAETNAVCLGWLWSMLKDHVHS